MDNFLDFFTEISLWQKAIWLSCRARALLGAGSGGTAGAPRVREVAPRGDELRLSRLLDPDQRGTPPRGGGHRALDQRQRVRAAARDRRTPLGRAAPRGRHARPGGAIRRPLRASQGAGSLPLPPHPPQRHGGRCDDGHTLPPCRLPGARALLARGRGRRGHPGRALRLLPHGDDPLHLHQPRELHLSRVDRPQRRAALDHAEHAQVSPSRPDAVDRHQLRQHLLALGSRLRHADRRRPEEGALRPRT